MPGEGLEQANQPQEKGTTSQPFVSELFHSVADVGKTAGYTFCEPVLGVAQIVDEAAGTHSMKTMQDGLASIGLERAKPTGTMDKYAQMLGGAIGMVAPYLLLHRAVRGAADGLGPTPFMAEGMSQANFGAFLGRETTLSFATGFGYNALRPSDDKHTGLNFVEDRLVNGVSGGAAMASLTASSLGLARVGSSSAIGSPWIKTALTNPMSVGAISAIPAGLASSEVDAWRKGKLVPTWTDARDNVAQMAFLGVTLGGAQFLGAPREGTDSTNFQSYIADPIVRRFSANAPDAVEQPQAATVSDAALRAQGPEVTVSDGSLKANPVTTFDTVTEAKPVTTSDTVTEARPVTAADAAMEATWDAELQRRIALAEGEIENMETPRQRAERLGRVKENQGANDFEQGKELVFAKVNQGDGKSIDVVIRPFDHDPRSFMRVHRADISDRVNHVVGGMTGVDSPTLTLMLRDNVTIPKVSGKSYDAVDWTGTVMIQENGGKPLGTQLMEWTRQANGLEPGAELPTGAITKFVNENPEVRALMGRATFDNMFKGNIDLVEFSQQTLPEANQVADLKPSGTLKIVAIDSKNDFTVLDRDQPEHFHILYDTPYINEPSSGFGAQFGLSLEVIKALEGKRLFEASPQLQTDAEAILKVFSSDEGVQKLGIAGLSPAEITAARQRLEILVERGFPKHIGMNNYYADGEAKTQLSASLNQYYDLEADKARRYLIDRDKNLGLTFLANGQLSIHDADAEAPPSS